MQMQVIDRPDGLTHIKLVGSLDIGGTGEIDMKFQGAVTSAREHALVDMTEVDFISSLGMRIFVESAKALMRTDHKLILVGCHPNVKMALNHARLEQLMQLVESEDDALAVLA
ncbi:MAG: STAS domain-containing protein [Phycisphaeraceae bacterium JB051]